MSFAASQSNQVLASHDGVNRLFSAVEQAAIVLRRAIGLWRAAAQRRARAAETARVMRLVEADPRMAAELAAARDRADWPAAD